MHQVARLVFLVVNVALVLVLLIVLIAELKSIRDHLAVFSVLRIVRTVLQVVLQDVQSVFHNTTKAQPLAVLVLLVATLVLGLLTLSVPNVTHNITKAQLDAPAIHLDAFPLLLLMDRVQVVNSVTTWSVQLALRAQSVHGLPNLHGKSVLVQPIESVAHVVLKTAVPESGLMQIVV